MSKENKKTVEVYQNKAGRYLETSIEHDNIDLDKANRKRQKLEEFIRASLESLPNGANVFEIGAGDGLNSKYMEELGYNVLASDVADDFINSIKSKGLKAIKFNILEDNFIEKYSAILCWRVFVHFTKEDARNVLQKVYNALNDGGYFIFNAINRETTSVDDEWVDFSNEYHMGAERYYKYFKEEELCEMIKEIGYQICDFHKEGGENSNKWLVYVLKK